MPLTDPALWARIRDHVLMTDGAVLAVRLTEVHPVHSGTAQNVLEEYRRFLYLTAISATRTVPSRAVDAVWHLHLEEGADDYAALCAGIGRTLHHRPGTPPGHDDDFAFTKRRYAEEFDTDPPEAYWGAPRARRGLLWLGAALLAFGGAAFVSGRAPFETWLIGGAGAALILLWYIFRRTSAKPIRLRNPTSRTGAACGGAWGDTNGADCGGGGCGGD